MGLQSRTVVTVSALERSMSALFALLGNQPDRSLTTSTIGVSRAIGELCIPVLMCKRHCGIRPSPCSLGDDIQYLLSLSALSIISKTFLRTRGESERLKATLVMTIAEKGVRSANAPVHRLLIQKSMPTTGTTLYSNDPQMASQTRVLVQSILQLIIIVVGRGLVPGNRARPRSLREWVSCSRVVRGIAGARKRQFPSRRRIGTLFLGR